MSSSPANSFPEPVTPRLACNSCGGPLVDDPSSTFLKCQFCGASTPRPLPEAIEAEIAEPVDPEWVHRWRDKIADLESAKSGRIGKLLLAVFLVLILGLAIAIGGAVSFGVQGHVGLAVITGVTGFVMFVTGIVLTVTQGIAISQVNKEIERHRERLRQFESTPSQS